MNIGEASDRSGLSAKTIRYYEEIGLVRPRRDANGYRAFVERDVHELVFLARARALGFTVEECRALLALWHDRGRASADVRRIAGEHLLRIERKLDELQAMHATLAELIGACAGDNRPDCPILRDLAGKDRSP
jgi:MerR family transcriptional regulator, copper efflux regulator